MLIEGPFTISIVDNGDSTNSKELHLKFTNDFKDSNVSVRADKLQAFISDLDNSSQGLTADDPDRNGMMIVKQIAEQLVGHILNDEMELDETIVVEINKEISINHLIDSSILN
jgi:hypothetical protein